MFDRTAYFEDVKAQEAFDRVAYFARMKEQDAIDAFQQYCEYQHLEFAIPASPEPFRLKVLVCVLKWLGAGHLVEKVQAENENERAERQRSLVRALAELTETVGPERVKEMVDDLS
jgi:hypothetical protein